MINAQEWLNQTYPTVQARNNLKRLTIGSKQQNNPSFDVWKVELSGELDLSDFRNLDFLSITCQPQLTKVKGIDKLTKLTQLTFFECPRSEPALTFIDR